MQKAAVIVGAALAFVACTALVYWLQGSSQRAPADAKFTHLHCAECGLEMRYNATNADKPCPQCGPTVGKLIATVGPANTATGARAVGHGGRLFVAVVVAAVVLQGGFYGWVLVARARRRAAEEAGARLLVCRCPYCARKIGYIAKKCGSGTTCSRCQTAFVLPDAMHAEPA